MSESLIPLQLNTLITISVVLLLLYTIYGAFWRLYLSPVAHVPGPRFAALTFWNEFYYDVVLGGKYTFKIQEYHEKYGPIIRINPEEVHISDPEFHDTLYVFSSKGKTDKWGWSMRMFGATNVSAFDTLAHDHHRLLRGPWNLYFSKASISRIQPLLIQNAVDKLCERLAEHQAAGKPVCVTHAYACLTTDIISEYSFPEGYDLLGRKVVDFDGENYDAWMALSRISHALKQFPWLFPLLDSMPQWITRITSPDFYVVLKEQNYLLDQAHLLAAQRQKANDYKEMTLRPSFLRHLFDSDLLPEAEKHPVRVKGEAQIAMGAGTLTTVHALKAATYHILSNPSIHARLMAELTQGFPNISSPPDLRQLESMHYLMAIMYETLRIFYGVTHRLSRIFPDRPLTYSPSALATAPTSPGSSKSPAATVTIPPGNPVSMTSVFTHDHPSIFPDPHTFNPDRWLPLDTNGQRLQKYLICFGKGSRQCAGMELGKAEFLTTLANVWRRFGDTIELHDTVRERDVDFVHDWFNPAARDDGNGVMVVLQKKGKT